MVPIVEQPVVAQAEIVLGPMSEDDFVVFARKHEKRKLEMLNSMVYDNTMSTSANHFLIFLNIAMLLREKLEAIGFYLGGETLLTRSGLPGSENRFEPDIVVVDKPLHEYEKSILVNPLAVVEILSQGNQHFDLNRKLTVYRETPSMREILHIVQDEYFIEHYVRNINGQWLSYLYTRATDTISFMGIAMQVSDVYKGCLFQVKPQQ